MKLKTTEEIANELETYKGLASMMISLSEVYHASRLADAMERIAVIQERRFGFKDTAVLNG